MPLLRISGIGISGIQAAVPERKIINKELTSFFDAESVAEIVEKQESKREDLPPKECVRRIIAWLRQINWFLTWKWIKAKSIYLFLSPKRPTIGCQPPR